MKFGFSSLIPPTFNILSLGDRGTGKTVFLVGSYAEFQTIIKNQENITEKNKSALPTSWFECQHTSEKFLLDNILNYVLIKGIYPPPTLKITDFHFVFKQQQSGKKNTLCYIRWWDMPGENCNFDNPYYQEMGVNSQGCCVFINANRLLHDANYTENFAYLKKQLMVLVSFVRNDHVEYPFSLIFTQCDLLLAGEEKKITAKVQDFIQELDRAGVNYKCFYSGIVITPQDVGFRLDSNEISSVFMWLVTDLYKHYQKTGRKLANLKILSTLHCLRCGSDRVNPSRSISFFKKLWLQLTLRKKYRCRDCGVSKIEFVPLVWAKELRTMFNVDK